MSHSPFFFMLLLLLLLLLPNQTQQATTLIAPVSKDKSTSLFTLSAYLKTPLRPTKLFLNLSFLFPWTLCEKSNYNSTSYRYIPCDLTTFCNTLGFGALGCTNCTDTTLPDPNCIPTDFVCGSFPENPITGDSVANDALIDTLALPNADESTHSQLVTLPNYTFSCAPSTLLKGLPKTVTGLAALSRSNLSVQAQISSALNAPCVFAVCFPGSSKSTGVAFFGSKGPYNIFTQSSKIDLAKSLIYTPLIVNPVALGDTQINYPDHPSSNEYFIDLTSVRVNGQRVPINDTLLSIDKESGFGGTKISTNTPYTMLESSIYKAFTELFVKEASSNGFNLTGRTHVKQFSVCYDAARVRVTDEGPVVPIVDLVLDKKGVIWRIVGSNSMVRIKNKKKKLDLWCLGFVDGGVNRKTPIVIGGKQLEENLVQFDLEANRMGFSSSLASRSLSCADFKVTDFAKGKH